MKHSRLLQVTRLSPLKEFDLSSVFDLRLGFVESPAEARRWGALSFAQTEQPAFDFD